ncbi:FAD-dependent monooxygenase [Methylobacterium nigriterrae]|uniref:FAD-dependent monooxygenase n=1 Tax=Methylobacterium nigriterrae TaxID=3127512 RepID=UPI003013AB2E
MLSQPGSTYHSPLEEVRIPSWNRSRVLPAGDAAHATAPVGAQAAALALEDAQVPAVFLSRGADRNRIGPDYERRQPRAAHVRR